MIEKTLILCPARISLNKIFTSILEKLSGEVSTFDVKAVMGKNRLIVNTQMRRFSYNIRSRWDRYFLKEANAHILREVSKCKPDLVLVYNSEYLVPETCSKIREKSKLVFFLGDSPFYTPQNDYYLASLSHADLILVPDTFWLAQLNTIGLDKTLYFIPGIEEGSYFKLDSSITVQEDEIDILYAGTSYKNSWGYKKAMLMSKFTDFNLRIYGNDAWERWFPFFPELERAFRRSGYIPTERLNRMFNRAKIIPVDGNPSILNGAHLRLIEALAAGSLPLIEYRKDVEDQIFRDFGADLPLIRNYGEARDIAAHWLNSESGRLSTIETMRSYILERYSPENNAERIREALAVR